ncbi:hypothetical protein [Marinobacterium iners]|uniref:Uncharacterized protein n=1 Tax=Marinobacterium iners DSM 11526 TaxID=1122198 RepID=A0A1H4E6X0_9GAMM|nr:hypothetical protein [Marinobacterium iners]SEA80567.1 hypothetical protein SAMN02745729_107175 [Marinobacterium iners DSM 11526]
MTTDEKNDDVQVSVEGPKQIGKANHHTRAASITLTTYVPQVANVKWVRAYIRNLPWGQGQCTLGSSAWVQAPLDGREPMGWCRAEGRGQGTTEHARWVKVQFYSWSHCNSREAKLEVGYSMPKSLGEEKEIVEIAESLWQEPSLGYTEDKEA